MRGADGRAFHGVVGGALLTGGYGSAIGAAVGAFIFGMTTQGIVFAGFDPNWFYTFLGATHPHRPGRRGPADGSRWYSDGHAPAGG